MKFVELPHLEFKLKEIEDYDNFIKNQKYIQICQKYDTIDIVIYREDYDNYTFCLTFSLYKQIQYKSDLTECNYYELVSKKKEIQERMESRALQIILQNIIGDKTFLW